MVDRYFISLENIIKSQNKSSESTCYILTDENGKNNAIFTGDTLFIGDVGRPCCAV